MQEPERREHLWGLVRHLGDALGVEAQSPIVPLIVGSEATAVAASAALLERGFYVPAIRPPTVAPGTCRSAMRLCSYTYMRTTLPPSSVKQLNFLAIFTVN